MFLNPWVIRSEGGKEMVDEEGALQNDIQSSITSRRFERGQPCWQDSETDVISFNKDPLQTPHDRNRDNSNMWKW
jgi:hypothetical protein